MQLAYEVHGRGPTLVLVHGLTHRRQAWDPVLPELVQRRRVVTVDLPGHGDSPLVPPGTKDVHRVILDAVDGMLDELAPDEARPHVAGNSLGGWVALQLAARGRVASATALSPAGFGTSRADRLLTKVVFRGSRSLARANGERLPAMLRNPLLRSVSLAPFFGKPWRVDPAAALADAHALMSNGVVDQILDQGFPDEDLTAPEVPVTIAWGRRDLLLPVHQVRAARRRYPQAKVVVLPGLGHVPMSDDPVRVGMALLAGSA
ncbi:alpha/beta fold hydrolase [Rhodococcus sp. X156]|uniref:alpha/beta fold hydrolase n=1 Tax=Rhodococcus sp. X156 TaxID=2499145 RepID=UPI000FDA3597|nr:alpha/beta fold hydrolase [Rhodococcus sp. X156]